jgi:hypothetical protein
MRTILLVLALVVSFGCASAQTTHPTTHPATDAPQVLHREDAVDLDDVARDDEQPDMTYQIASKRSPHIYFGQLDVFDDDDKVTATTPIIAWNRNDHWTAIKISDSRLKNAAWKYVVAGPTRGEIWGVLDQDLDDKENDVLLVHSIDAGQTFNLIAIRKPKPAADFDSFCMDRTGHGRVTVYLEMGDGKHDERPGYYHYRTTDGGKTWSAPEYEPDGTAPADDVPDDQQPSDNPKPIQKA